MKTLKNFFVLIWAFKSFLYSADVVNFLNSLPKERQLEAKIITINAIPKYEVFYRMESK